MGDIQDRWRDFFKISIAHINHMIFSPCIRPALLLSSSANRDKEIKKKRP